MNPTLRVELQPPDDDHPHDNSGVVIVVSHQTPAPIAAGNEFRLANLLDFLRSQRLRVIPVVCPLEPAEAERLLPALADTQPEFVLVHRDGRLEARMHSDTAILEKLDGQATPDFGAWEERRVERVGDHVRGIERHYTHPVLLATVDALVSALHPRAIIANYVFAAGVLDLADSSRTLRVIDTIDVFSRRHVYVDQPGLEGETVLSSDEERRLLESADVAVAIHETEAELLASLIHAHPEVITCGVSMPYRPVAIVPGGGKTVGIIGSNNALNVHGLQHFLRTVWPLVLDQEPEASLAIAGQLSDFVPAWAPRTVRLGRVSLVADFYAQVAAVANPAIAGTGLKIKTVEALAHGRPITCWPNGADGLDSCRDRGVYVAEDAVEFAEHILDRLAESPSGADELGHLVETEFSPVRVFAPLARTMGLAG